VSLPVLRLDWSNLFEDAEIFDEIEGVLAV